MSITCLPRSLTISVVLIVASVVSGRPWDGNNDMRASNGGLAERNFAMFSKCPDAAARCSAQQGIGAYLCYLRSCPRALDENVLRETLDVCWPEVKAEAHDVTSGTCAFALCLKRHLGSDSEGDLFDNLVDTACMEQVGLDRDSEVEGCLLACKEQSEEDFGECVQTFCVKAAPIFDDGVTKRMTTRMNGCKTAEDCQMELMNRVGKRSDVELTAGLDKRVSSRVNGCKTAECVMRVSGLAKKWAVTEQPEGGAAKRVTTRMNSCSTAAECGNQLLHMMGNKRVMEDPKFKRVVSRLNGCSTAEECGRLLLAGKRMPSGSQGAPLEQKRMSSRVNGCRNTAECESQLMAALGK